MNKYKTERKKINGAFLLVCAVKFLIVALSYAVSYIIAYITGTGTLYDKVVTDLSGYGEVSGQLFNFAIYVLGAGVPVIIYFALKGRPSEKKDELLLATPTFFQTGYAVGATVLISNFISGIWLQIVNLFYTYYGYTSPYYYTTETGTPTNVWLMGPYLIMMALLPALIEEFIMRGAVLISMRNFSRGLTVILSGLVFMMMHNTLEQMALSFSAGVCLAYFTLKFRSVWVAVIAHFVINLNSSILGLMFELFEGSDLLFIYGIYTIMYNTLMLAFVIAGPILYGIRLPKVSKPTAEDRKGTVKALFSSPFFYIFMIIFILVTAENILAVIG